MLRMILGVILGYVIMALLVFTGLTAAYLSLGTDRVFAPGTYEVSGLWLATNITISSIAGFLGCIAGGMIARTSKAAMVLCGIVLVLGLAIAVNQALAPKPDPGPRDGQVANLDAMMKARQPNWYMFTMPVIGGLAALAAERVLRKQLGK